MRHFRLQDIHNKSVHCVAHDRHSGNSALEEGNMVVLYFAQAQSGLRSSQPGALWLYNESHVVFVKKGCRVLPSVGTVHLQGSASSGGLKRSVHFSALDVKCANVLIDVKCQTKASPPFRWNSEPAG